MVGRGTPLVLANIRGVLLAENAVKGFGGQVFVCLQTGSNFTSIPSGDELRGRVNKARNSRWVYRIRELGFETLGLGTWELCWRPASL